MDLNDMKGWICNLMALYFDRMEIMRFPIR